MSFLWVTYNFTTAGYISMTNLEAVGDISWSETDGDFGDFST